MTPQPGQLDTNLFRENPCRFLDRAIKEYVRTSPLNHLTFFDSAPFVDEPLVAFGDGDDPIFRDLKTIVGEFHMTPREVLEKYIADKGWRFGMAAGIDKVGIVSWALPITVENRLPERKALFGGSTRYNHTRWIGIQLYENLEKYVASLLEVLRCNAVAPTQSRFFEIKQMPGDWLAANWSERHIAYACGLGTFGLNGLMITSHGCAVYLGSVVFDRAVTPTPREPSHIAYCPYFRDGSCGKCIEHCPGAAIGREGRSNVACLKNLRDEQPNNIRTHGLDTDLVGRAPACGRCSTGLPCEERIPPHAAV